MLSPSILNQGKISEDQFIGDLMSLFRRRNISFGQPEDLERLASHLTSDNAFRGGLFNLCAVISHMSEVDLTPQQLLVLVARACGGPGIFNGEGHPVIPHDTESAFLTGYEAWTKREPDLDAYLDRRHHEPFHAAMALSSAEGFRAATPGHPAGVPPAPRPIPANAPLDSLTLGELRQYLDEIERRVSQIEPHLDQVVRNIPPTAAHFGQLEAVEPETVHDPEPLAHTPEPIPEPIVERAPEPAIPAVEEAHAIETQPEPIADSVHVVIEEIAQAETAHAESIHSAGEAIPEVEMAHEPAVAEHAIAEEAAVAEPILAPNTEIEKIEAEQPEAPHTEALLAEPETPQAEHSEHVIEEQPTVPAPKAEAEPETPQAEPVLAALAVVPAQLSQPAIQLQTRSAGLIADSIASEPDEKIAANAARLRRLRVANIVLAILLVISAVFAGFVAVRYFESRPINFAATFASPQAPSVQFSSQSATPSSRTAPATPTTHTPPAVASNAHPLLTPQKSSADEAPPDAIVFPQAAATPEIKTPAAPITRQAPEPVPAPAQAAATPPPAETRPAAPAPPQVAEARPATPAPATVPRSTPAPQTPSGPLNVPSARMITYATASPAPAPPRNRHSILDTTVEVMATISKEGKVVNVQALSGPNDVRPAAVEAMKAWRFKPYVVDGKPVEVVTTLKFLFKAQ